MSGIHGKNTTPELTIRHALHSRGFRYLLHSSSLPGKPDMVFPKYGAVIFVHGCFWHAHDCKYFKLPRSRTEFWREKFKKNKQRDEAALATISALGWRVLLIWECATREIRAGKSSEIFIDVIEQWITSGTSNAEIGMDGQLVTLIINEDNYL